MPRARNILVALCLAGVVELQARAAAAEPSPDRDQGLRWQQHWPRFHWAEYTATSLLLGGAIVAGIAGRDELRWQSANGFDDGIRTGLRLGPALQDGASTASDALLGALFIYPYLDAGLAWWAHDSPDVAWQMAMINTQSFALTAAITTGVKLAAGRMRPYARDCKQDDAECMGDNHASSFFSGHASYAFTSAGLICAHHTNLDLYGGGAPDYLACAAALGAATATGFLRIAADRHYATDVLAGAAVGFLSGYVLPNLLHYRFGAAAPDDAPGRDAPRISVTPVGGPSYIGLGVSGVF